MSSSVGRVTRSRSSARAANNSQTNQNTDMLTEEGKKWSKPTNPFFIVPYHVNRFWVWYLTQLVVSPLLTKSISAAVLSVVSDVLAQCLLGVYLVSQLDYNSCFKQFMIGLLFRAWPIHYWYLFLDKLFVTPSDANDDVELKTLTTNQLKREKPVAKANEQETPFKTVIAKVALDQLTFGPLYNLVYFYVIGFVDQLSMDEINGNINREYWNIMITNWKVWPFICIVNFKFVPLNLQVLVGNVASIFWNAFIILSTSNK